MATTMPSTGASSTGAASTGAASTGAATGAVVAGTSARIEVREVPAVRAAIVSVAGRIGRGDAAVLSRVLHKVLDAAPAVLVVDLGEAGPLDPATLNVLAVVGDRARAADVGCHLVDRGQPAVAAQLRAASLA